MGHTKKNKTEMMARLNSPEVTTLVDEYQKFSRHMLIKAQSERELLIAEINPLEMLSAFLFLFISGSGHDVI